MAKYVRSSAHAEESTAVMVPNQPEFEVIREHKNHDMPINDKIWQLIVDPPR